MTHPPTIAPGSDHRDYRTPGMGTPSPPGGPSPGPGHHHHNHGHGHGHAHSGHSGHSDHQPVLNLVTAGLSGSGMPTPLSAATATPAFSESPAHLDLYSPASTSYLPTPPLAPPHMLQRHQAAAPAGPGPSMVHRSSYHHDGDISRRGSDAFLHHRSSDGRRSSDTYAMSGPSRRGSEPLSSYTPFEDGRVGVEDPCSERTYTELKVLGDGSFGTVWLCDWHSKVKPDVLLSAMQCGAGARPEWTGKRLVALKRMKRVFEGGWKQARDLGELKSLRTIPPHDAIIPLYDAFISPRSRELYFVFECMEGNLYQLTKSRKGRPLAAGLIASCFRQIVDGLDHIHTHRYFHRDMKPENLLVTTTGLCDYLSAAAVNEIAQRRAAHAEPLQINSSHIQQDVQVIVKLADFGLARVIDSDPPYTEYVSTRWYRAPEVLLRADTYGAEVDMWAFGTILAEMVNLKPLFPGVSEIDQVYRICDILGDPSDHGRDERGWIIGGGRWYTGLKHAKRIEFKFPKRKPVDIRTLFPRDTPQTLIDCIDGLLKYNTKYRFTAHQCKEMPYYAETKCHLEHAPPLPCIPFALGQPENPVAAAAAVASAANSRHTSPAHLAHQEVLIPVHTPDAQVRAAMVRDDSGPHGASALVHQLRALDLPTDDLASYGFREPSEEPMYDRPPNVSPHVAAYVQQQQQHYMQQQAMRQVTQSMPSLPTHHENRSDPSSHSTINVSQVPSQQSLHSPPPEMSSSAGTALGSLNKKKKWLGAVFGNNNSEKHPELAAVDEQPGYSGLKRTQSGHYADERILDPKVAKKLAEREQLELLKAKRDADARAQAERSRAVMQKRQQFLDYSGDSVEHINLTWGSKKVPISSMHPHAGHGGHSGQVAHGGPSGHGGHREREHSAHREHSHLRQHGSHPYSHGHEGRNKSRKTAEEDDHSSVGRVSSRSRSLLSVGTIESEPVGVIGTGGGTGGGGGGGASSRWNPRSTSSIMTPSTASLESQLATQLARHATVASASDSSLSLGRRVHAPSTSQLHPAPVYDHRSVRVPGRSANLPSILGDWPPGPPDEIKDQINPIFRVPQQSSTTLPPFSDLARVADHRNQ